MSVYPIPEDQVERKASLSDDGRFRYSLERRWGGWHNGAAKEHARDPKRVTFVGLNPSTADATFDDPTIRRCVGFAVAWGFDALLMLNLFAFRATDPADLVAAGCPVGESADWLYADLADDVVVCCWGAAPFAYARGEEVVRLLQTRIATPPKARQIVCFGTTKSGAPKHPLYLPRAAAVVPFADAAAAGGQPT